MVFEKDQEVILPIDTPIYTIQYLGKDKQELFNVGKNHKERNVKIIFDPINQSTAYDANHSYVLIDNYSLWIIKNEHIKLQ
jgi:hypothetical protein